MGYKEYLNEAIPKGTSYALVINDKVVEIGSKKEMQKLMKKKGGKIWLSPGSKIGDTLKR